MPEEDIEMIIVQHLENELEELEMIIDEFNPKNLPQVKRYGLPIFGKELML